MFLKTAQWNTSNDLFPKVWVFFEVSQFEEYVMYKWAIDMLQRCSSNYYADIRGKKNSQFNNVCVWGSVYM